MGERIAVLERHVDDCPVCPMLVAAAAGQLTLSATDEAGLRRAALRARPDAAADRSASIRDCTRLQLVLLWPSKKMIPRQLSPRSRSSSALLGWAKASHRVNEPRGRFESVECPGITPRGGSPKAVRMNVPNVRIARHQ